jgi:hypothetical protein
MESYDCPAVAHSAIKLLRSGLFSVNVIEKRRYLCLADDLIQSQGFEWQAVPVETADEYDTLFERLQDEIN